MKDQKGLTLAELLVVIGIIVVLIALLLPAMASGALNGANPLAKKPNVLFIAVDDLRTELGCYGKDHVRSPNIDRLAVEGMRFEHAYCQQPICMASRASLMSGLRPTTSRIYSCLSVKELIPDVRTLNQHFERNGYNMLGLGKIYHYSEDHEAQFSQDRYEDRIPEAAQGRGYITPEAIAKMREHEKQRRQNSEGRGPAYECAAVSDTGYSDGLNTEYAMEALDRFSKDDKPFFMAIGFRKPHLPFNAPKKYWDMYDADKIALADNPFLPKDGSRYNTTRFGELRNYHGIPVSGKISDETARVLLHGYYACVSYTDALIGRLVDKLDSLGLRDNTVIVLWGDHGWKLGEHGLWCKHTAFDLDAHAPLIFAGPGVRPKNRSQALAEFVDIYPTLCDLCGLDKPAHLEGTSLTPVLNEPDRKWKRAAFTYWPVQSRTQPSRVVLGHSVRTPRYRYTEWIHLASGEIKGRDLFDHQVDPKENTNVAKRPENTELVKRLHAMVQKGWKDAVPEQDDR